MRLSGMYDVLPLLCMTAALLLLHINVKYALLASTKESTDAAFIACPVYAHMQIVKVVEYN